MSDALTFRLFEKTDPEERLENAALWKAMFDEYGDKIQPLLGATDHSDIVADFGVELKEQRLGSGIIEYWNDPIFLSLCNRHFDLVDFDGLRTFTEKMQSMGKGVFWKDVRPKTLIGKIGPSERFQDAICDVAYSLIDRPKCILAQELCTVTYEQRFMVIDRQVITWSPVAWHLTPIDTHAIGEGVLFETPQSRVGVERPDRVLLDFAQKIAKESAFPDVNIDCAWFNDRPAVIEYNPMRLGQLGLYACDVRLLAKASRKLLTRR